MHYRICLLIGARKVKRSGQKTKTDNKEKYFR